MGPCGRWRVGAVAGVGREGKGPCGWWRVSAVAGAGREGEEMKWMGVG